MVKKVGLVFLVVTVVAVGAYGGGFALSGVGSKALGMGGAFRGLADNWSAAYWNPAGLAQLRKSEFNVMSTSISPRPEFNPQVTIGGYDVGFKNGVVRYPDDKTTFSPNVSGFLRLPSRGNLTFGVALFVPYYLDSEWDLFEPIYEDIIEPYPIIDHKLKLDVIDIHPSLAKSFMDDRLMLGVGMSILNGEIDYRKPILSPTSLPRPHENIAIDAVFHGEGWGYGANAGVIYKLSDKLQLGISGKTGTTIKFDGNVKKDLYAINNIILEEEALEEASTSEDSMAIGFIFSEIAKESWQNEAKADLKLPVDIGIGFAYSLGEKTTLTFDLSYTFWSRLDSVIIKLEGNNSPVDTSSAQDMIIRTKWEDIYRLSFGGEHYFADQFSIRFGFYYEPSPIPDETLTPLIPDIGAKYGTNIGTSLKISDWELGYNFEYVNYASKDLILDTDVGLDFDNYPGSYKSYCITNNLSITFRF